MMLITAGALASRRDDDTDRDTWQVDSCLQATLGMSHTGVQAVHGHVLEGGSYT